jgi:hypothetical protein
VIRRRGGGGGVKLWMTRMRKMGGGQEKNDKGTIK